MVPLDGSASSEQHDAEPVSEPGVRSGEPRANKRKDPVTQLCELTAERTRFAEARPNEAFPTRVALFRGPDLVATIVDDLDHDAETITDIAIKSFNATHAEVIYDGMFALGGDDFESNFSEALVHRTLKTDGTIVSVALPFRRLADNCFAWLTPVNISDSDNERRPFSAASLSLRGPRIPMTAEEQKECDCVTAIALLRLGVAVNLVAALGDDVSSDT